jgi:hypothetical protein
LDKVLLSDLDGGFFIVDATKAAGPDADGDGIPDAWETDHGLDPKEVSDGAADSDGDASSNLFEFLSATDPRDASSVTRIASAERTGAQVQVKFPTKTGTFYSLERNSRLSTNGWTILKDEIEGTGAEMSVIHTNAVNLPQQFYRLSVRP